MMLPRSYSGLNGTIPPGYQVMGYCPGTNQPNWARTPDGSVQCVPDSILFSGPDPIMQLPPASVSTSTDPIVLTPPPTPAQNAVAGATLGTGSNALANSGVPVAQTVSGDLMLGSVDLSALPTWAYVAAAGVVALLVLRK